VWRHYLACNVVATVAFVPQPLRRRMATGAVAPTVSDRAALVDRLDAEVPLPPPDGLILGRAPSLLPITRRITIDLCTSSRHRFRAPAIASALGLPRALRV
jgi:hypothetical protein